VDDRLAISVRHADGRTSRWGPDEVDAADVPTRLRFGTTVPGGFKDMTCSLLRRIDLTYPDQALFDDVTVYGPGSRVAWNGRLVQFPRSHGAGFAITPGAVGWSAHLRDDPSFAMIYADQDLSRWGVSSRSWKLALIGQNYQVNDGQVVPDRTSMLPGLTLAFDGAWAAPAMPECAMAYDAGPGLKIGAIYLYWGLGGSVGTAAPWAHRLYVADVDDNTATTAIGTNANLPSTGQYLTLSTPRRYAFAELRYDATPAGTQGFTYEVDLRQIAVYGDHGLTRRGADPGGFYASDVVADIVTRAAPLLTFSRGPGGSIEDTTFVIPHLAFHDPVTAEDALLATNAFHMWEWGVYDHRRFFFRAPDPSRLLWQARIDQGAHLDVDGLSADEVFNGVLVRYQDPAGNAHTVGPPGATAEATDASLADTSAANPVNAHGIPRRWARLDLSQMTTQAGAIQIGRVFLAERAQSNRKGSMRLTGTVTHPTKGARPVWEMRAGDFIEVADHPDPSPRRIIESDYDHDSRTISLSLDSTVHKLEAILERLGASLVGVV
jgi:hypothetical protein